MRSQGYQRKPEDSSVQSVRLLILLCVLSIFALPFVLRAAPPQWWTDRGVLVPAAQANDYAAINQGQLKNLATAAAIELDANLPIGAGADVHDLISGWSSLQATTDDYASVNLGQLKAVGKPFYDQLILAGYTNQYPWTGHEADANNYAAANIGQVKHLFAFDLLLDSDRNGLPDWWEKHYFNGQTEVDPEADPDSDGMTNLEEYYQGLNPNIANLHINLTGSDAIYSSPSAVLNASITLYDNVPLISLTLNGSAIAIQTGNFQLRETLAEGTNTFVLAATDQQGHTGVATAMVLLKSSISTIAIIQPPNNATFDACRIDVHGTIQNPNSVSCINVNGIQAFISNGSFEALNVPIAIGANTITATATDEAGNSSTSAIYITGDDGGSGMLNDPVNIQVSPHVGFVPLSTTFQVQQHVPGLIQEIHYDFIGDHSNYISKTDLSPLTNTYSIPGEYFPVVTIITSLGSFSSYGGFDSFGPRQGVLIRANSLPNIASTINIADPVDLAIDPTGNLYVLSRSEGKVYEFDQNGQTIRSSSNVGTAPCGICVDMYGNVYIAITGNNQVIRLKPFDAAFMLDSSFGQGGMIGNPDKSAGSTPTAFDAPYDVAISPTNDAIYISDKNNNRIQKYTIQGTYSNTIGSYGTAAGQFDAPKGLYFSANACLYVADSGNNRVVCVEGDEVFAAKGSIGTAMGSFQSPAGLSIDTEGMYVADTGNNRVEGFAAGEMKQDNLQLLWCISSEMNLNTPTATASDISDFRTRLYIADNGNNRILLVTFPTPDSQVGVWNAMKQQIGAGDIRSALLMFSKTSVGDYRTAFYQMGVHRIAGMLAEIGQIFPVQINNNDAEYRFDKKIAGNVISFPVHFVKENGRWKILDF